MAPSMYGSGDTCCNCSVRIIWGVRPRPTLQCVRLPCPQTINDDVSSYSSIQGLTFEEEARCQKCDCNLLANCNFCQNCGHKVNIDGAFASRRTYE